MKNFFLFFFLILIQQVCFSQNNSIRLRNKINGTERVIKEGEKIRVSYENKHFAKGNFIIVNDSLLTIKEDTISISEIQTISRRPLISQIVSIPFLVVGGAVMILSAGGIIYIYAVYGGNGDSGMGVLMYSITFLAGCVVEGFGLLTSVILDNNYKSKKWAYEFSKINPAPNTLLTPAGV